MTNTIEIPLNKLVPFIGNVRKTNNKAFIAELAASIRAHGLQQNLVVKKDGAKYAVVAGGQRLKALMQLAKEGDIKPSYRVPCKVANEDIDAAELSLAENVMREDMHPADQFEAFRDLVDRGIPAVDIAARFGKSLDHVNRLLKLARVSRAVLKAYRADGLTLQQVMAFTVSDDHKAQDHVLENVRPHTSAQAIREALTENEIPASDKRVKFVTLKAYEAAGGTTRFDLFSEGDDSIFVLDTALLDRLLTEKLAKVAQSVAKKEGWKWTEAHADFGYQEKAQFKTVRSELTPLPPKLAKEADKLLAEADKLETEWGEADGDAPLPKRLPQIRKRLAEIDATRSDEWSSEKLAIAGTVVTIGSNGKAEILRGFVRPEDMPKEAKKGKGSAAKSEDGAEGAENQSPALSAALAESLTAHKSAAIAAELAERPDVALAAVVHALASRVLFERHTEDRALQIGASSQSLHRVEGSKAFEQMEASLKRWRGQLPADADALWTWCLEQKQKTLLELLAFCAAWTVNAVQGKADKPEGRRLRNAQALASALKLDMKVWFTTDAANYYSHVAKPQIFAAMQEVRTQPPAPAWEKLKKPELAQLAERELAGKGWLPEVLRPTA
jgi:ParB family chromosome partitioning protein